MTATTLPRTGQAAPSTATVQSPPAPPRSRRILAGPGAGKTRALIGWILELLETGVDPIGIIAITFTKRAANEMKQRLARSGRRVPWMDTIHALAYRILADLRLLPQPVASNLDKLIPLATAALRDGRIPPWVRKIRYIGVDEAQDLDGTQVELLQALGQHTQHVQLLLVGDPDQAIYGFRRASAKYLLRAPEIFKQTVGDMDTETLSANHRSAPAIVQTARNLISSVAEPENPCHTLTAVRTESHPAIRWLKTATEEEEAVRIFEEVRTFLALNIPAKEIGILVRVRAQMPTLQAVAARHNIKLYLPPLRDQLEPGREQPEAPSDCVQLLTMHQAKGLEFAIVFLAGIQEGLMPYRRATTSEAIYEELRLLYVAVTRAKQLLWFCYHGVPSRFLHPVREAEARPALQSIPLIPAPTASSTRVCAPPRPRPAPKPAAETLLGMLMGWIRKGFTS